MSASCLAQWFKVLDIFFRNMALQATDPAQSPKRKVLALGYPSYASKDCVRSFQHDFALDVSTYCNSKRGVILY